MPERTGPTASSPLRLATLLALLSNTSCGGSAPDSAAPKPEISSLDQAEAELERAEAVIFPRALQEPGADPAVQPKHQVPAQPAAPLSDAGGDASACETSCGALASMKRAAERVCSLAGEGERCDKARGRVTRARERVIAACSECDA